MKRAIIQRPDAVRDLRAIIRHVARSSPSSAERTFALLASRPSIGEKLNLDELIPADVRVTSIGRFRSYLIFYQATEVHLEIIRILHASRDLDDILADTFGPPEEE